jgi:hypothetical protein
VHGTGVYSAGVGPKGPALERFLDIKKKKKKKKKKRAHKLLFACEILSPVFDGCEADRSSCFIVEVLLLSLSSMSSVIPVLFLSLLLV